MANTFPPGTRAVYSYNECVVVAVSPRNEVLIEFKDASVGWRRSSANAGWQSKVLANWRPLMSDHYYQVSSTSQLSDIRLPIQPTLDTNKRFMLRTELAGVMDPYSFFGSLEEAKEAVNKLTKKNDKGASYEVIEIAKIHRFKTKVTKKVHLWDDTESEPEPDEQEVTNGENQTVTTEF